MEPVVNSSASNTCSDPISSNCVNAQLPLAVLSTLGICGTASVTQVETAVAMQLSNLLQQLQLTEAQYAALPTPTPPLDFSGLDFSCLLKPIVTTTYTCPCTYIGPATDGFASLYNGSQVYVPGVNGNPGYCGILGPTGKGTYVTGVGWVSQATNCIPVITTTASNPAVPNTLIGILQLIINKQCSCCP